MGKINRRKRAHTLKPAHRVSGGTKRKGAKQNDQTSNYHSIRLLVQRSISWPLVARNGLAREKPPSQRCTEKCVCVCLSVYLSVSFHFAYSLGARASLNSNDARVTLCGCVINVTLVWSLPCDLRASLPLFVERTLAHKDDQCGREKAHHLNSPVRSSAHRIAIKPQQTTPVAVRGQFCLCSSLLISALDSCGHLLASHRLVVRMFVDLSLDAVERLDLRMFEFSSDAVELIVNLQRRTLSVEWENYAPSLRFAYLRSDLPSSFVASYMAPVR